MHLLGRHLVRAARELLENVLHHRSVPFTRT
jgi:hypothetical protein